LAKAAWCKCDRAHADQPEIRALGSGASQDQDSDDDAIAHQDDGPWDPPWHASRHGATPTHGHLPGGDAPLAAGQDDGDRRAWGEIGATHAHAVARGARELGSGGSGVLPTR